MKPGQKRSMWLGGVAILAGLILLVLNISKPGPATPPVKDETNKADKADRAPVSTVPSGKVSPRKSEGTKSERPSGTAAGLPEPEESPHAIGTEENSLWVDEKTEELNRLAWFDDPASLDKILAEMRNTQPEVREAALQSVVSFGSKDAIPKLEVLARGTSDVGEQKAIADAIEYLSLPTMVEHLEENPPDPQPVHEPGLDEAEAEEE